MDLVHLAREIWNIIRHRYLRRATLARLIFFSEYPICGVLNIIGQIGRLTGRTAYMRELHKAHCVSIVPMLWGISSRTRYYSLISSTSLWAFIPAGI